MWCWLHVVGSSAVNRIAVAYSSSQYTDLVQYIGVDAGGLGISGVVANGVHNDFVTGAVSIGNRYFVVLNIDKAGKTAELFIDNVSIGTTPVVPVDTAVNDAFNVCLRANSSDSALGTNDFVDALGVVMTRKLTISEIAYLYNSGTGKSYADVVADGA
jgi:hypothetical protein